jgi:hypothetical protein
VLLVVVVTIHYIVAHSVGISDFPEEPQGDLEYGYLGP